MPFTRAWVQWIVLRVQTWQLVEHIVHEALDLSLASTLLPDIVPEKARHG